MCCGRKEVIMRRTDVVKKISGFGNTLCISLIDTEGMLIHIESTAGFTVRYLMQLLYTACNTKQVLQFTDGSRMLIENRAYDKPSENGTVGSVTIQIKDPLFGRIFCQQYFLTADDQERYDQWLENRNNK